MAEHETVRATRKAAGATSSASRNGCSPSPGYAGLTVRAVAQQWQAKVLAHGQTLVDHPAMAHRVWDSLVGVADDPVHGGSLRARLRY